MKGIFLTAVVICALAIAGIGGVFANYQDIDISSGNYFETGDLDLKVSDSYGNWWDTPNIPVLIEADNFMPECQDKSFHFDLHNVGDYEQGTGWVYMHIKNLVFEDTDNKMGEPKAEPEVAVESGLNPIGELADGTPVCLTGPDGPPNGPLGLDWGTAGGELAEHIEVAIGINYVSPSITDPNWVWLDLSAYDDDPANGVIKLNELVCEQILLGELDSCNEMYVWVALWFQDIPEEDLGYDLFPGTASKWNDWPTNALMNDMVTFDISFELFQFQLP
jgi:hypothetical protein